jgi:hypothetical protein
MIARYSLNLRPIARSYALRSQNRTGVSDNPQSVRQKTLCKEEQFETLPFSRPVSAKRLSINRCLSLRAPKPLKFTRHYPAQATVLHSIRCSEELWTRKCSR